MILDSAERIQFYTDRGLWGTVTLLDIFKGHVKRFPNKTALIDPLNKEALVGLQPERFTYNELDRVVDTVATSLIEMGLQQDDVVIVQLPNIWELAVAYLAISRAGGIISPLPVQWRAAELKYIGALTKANMYIAAEEFKGHKYLEMAEKAKEELPDLKHIVSLSEFRQMAKGSVDAEKLESVKPTANDVFTVCWTSGTEAMPKGCPMTHNNWIAHGTKLAGVSRIEEGATQMCNAPLVNMAAIGVIYNTWLLRSGTLVLHHPFDWKVAYQQIMDERVNTALLVPAVLHMILRDPDVDQYDLSSLTTVTTGSAPPSAWSFVEFKRRWGIEIVNLCGGNEGVLFCSGPEEVPDLETRTTQLPWWGKARTSWQYGAGVESKIVDPETRSEITEVGGIGELAYKGPNTIAGYWGRTDLTQQAFDEEGYYYTGDLFKIVDDNLVSFFDRKKDIIIRGGYNISAQEVENLVQGHPKVTDVAAVAMPDETLGEKVCIFVVPQQGEKVTLEEIAVFMKGKDVAIYKLPERLETVDAIPRNPVGKILKTELREELKNKLGSQTGRV